MLALSYERKVAALMSAVGHEHLCFDIDSFDPALTFERFRSLMAELGRHRDELDAYVSVCTRQVNEQYDRVFGRASAALGNDDELTAEKHSLA